MIQIKLSERIRELREDNDLTQTEMAKILKSTQRTISNWENNNAEPPYETLIEIAKFFNVSTDYILGLTNDKRKTWENKNSIIINGGKNKIKII